MTVAKATAAMVHNFAGFRRGLNGGSCAKLLDFAPYSGVTEIGGGGADRVTGEAGGVTFQSVLAAGSGWTTGGACAGAGVGALASASTSSFSGSAASWNQLWRQDAQRTERPLSPMALSGTR